MARLTGIILSVLFLTLCAIDHFEGSLLKRSILSKNNERVKRQPNAGSYSYPFRFSYRTGMIFDYTVVPGAKDHRTFNCFFVFDQAASSDLDDSTANAMSYANALAEIASNYTAHANIVVRNAGVELWSSGNRISFNVPDTKKNYTYAAMPDFVTRFQAYLAQNYAPLFGTKYTVGVLISNQPTLVGGGYSQARANTTSGVSLLMYREVPWSIGGLLAHELAHTISVVHAFELDDLCKNCKGLSFCTRNCPTATYCGVLPDECTCNTTPAQCLMTYQFGAATAVASRYTSCDIEMMNYFSTHDACYSK